MTAAASRREIGWIYGGRGIARRLDIMDSVTAGAIGDLDGADL